MDNFVQYCLNNGGKIKPLIIPHEQTGGTGLLNPTVFIDNGKIFVNIRHCQYTLYHAELSKYEHHWGPLLYLTPDDDMTLTTTNYFGILNDDLSIQKIHKLDTSKLDKPPLWEFVNLEDVRLVKWNNKYYYTGVRRDTDTIGTGRMELSEIEIDNDYVKEVARYRIPAPGWSGNKGSYCEKNWMPILDQPFHYVKWTNPTEVVKCDISDPENITCEQVFLGEYEPLNYDLRGGSQVIPYKDGYLALNHITYLYRSKADRKDGTYRHQFTYWDKNWNVIKRSEIFHFMGAKIEFSCGVAKHNNNYIITFGFQDNASYVLTLPEKTLDEFIFD